MPNSSLEWSVIFIGHTFCFSLLTDYWVICVALAGFLLPWFYISSIQPRSAQKRLQPSKPSIPSEGNAQGLSWGNISTRYPTGAEDVLTPTVQPSRVSKNMSHTRNARLAKKKKKHTPSNQSSSPKSKQPFQMFLVLDIEGTCDHGSDFNFPNEIIEFPVCLMRWDGSTNELILADEFKTFVKPTWRPTLSKFCTELTGIQQEQVDAAPHFSDVLVTLENFLIRHGLIDKETGERLVKFCWCSDGPFDIRDFVVKQCFISQVTMPRWLQGDVLDVRTLVLQWISSQSKKTWNAATRCSLNISAQLRVLDMPGFEGRQHSGIDDTRNVARIVAELARRGVSLLPNTVIHPDRRWPWMGKHGQVMEHLA